MEEAVLILNNQCSMLNFQVCSNSETHLSIEH
jgi:hypothetical protein